MAKDRPNYQRSGKVGPGPTGSVSQYAQMNPKEAAAIAAAMKGGKSSAPPIPKRRQSGLAKSDFGK